jgi:hypothetical protein
MPGETWLARALPKATVTARIKNRECMPGFAPKEPASPCCHGLWRRDTRHRGGRLEQSATGAEIFVGCHHDLRRVARIRALLALIVERLAS